MNYEAASGAVMVLEIFLRMRKDLERMLSSIPADTEGGECTLPVLDRLINDFCQTGESFVRARKVLRYKINDPTWIEEVLSEQRVSYQDPNFFVATQPSAPPPPPPPPAGEELKKKKRKRKKSKESSSQMDLKVEELEAMANRLTAALTPESKKIEIVHDDDDGTVEEHVG